MDSKKTGPAHTTITRDADKIGALTGNLYEAIVVASKRADQIAQNTKNELDKKLEEFASSSDNLEEIFENREQIEISKHYERLAKPLAIALDEMEEGKVFHRYADKKKQINK